MAKSPELEVQFEDEGEEQDVAEHLTQGTVAAVVTGTDWTTETIFSQLKRGNIQLNPRFQRRDAWQADRKSRFIESLIVGLPIPQIVLAESPQRGKFIVLDGKQRLLSIMQFWTDEYSLTSLPLREDLIGVTFSTLSTDVKFEDDYSSLSNQPIRTVVIKNWKDTNFLHTVFLRLNTGSVKLSPQELRQALLPGKFTDYIDDQAATSAALKNLLGLSGPDPRMRDTEVLARFLAFRFFADKYPGRMKDFLDGAFRSFNSDWSTYEKPMTMAIAGFEAGVSDLLRIFGNAVARKPTSRQFNRAIFDALIYFQSQPSIRQSLRSKTQEVKQAYTALFRTPSAFLKAVESDTAGAPNTAGRLHMWAASLSKITGHKIDSPKIPISSSTKKAMPKKK